MKLRNLRNCWLTIPSGNSEIAFRLAFRVLRSLLEIQRLRIRPHKPNLCVDGLLGAQQGGHGFVKTNLPLIESESR
jgi:hypothetical protein